MNNTTPLFNAPTTALVGPTVEIRKGQTDLKVLRYMAQRVLATLHSPDNQIENATPTNPLLYMLQECRGRAHRMAIYQPQTLLMLQDMLFVGFFSKKKTPLKQQIIEHIDDADKQMLIELTGIPGLLSYSSLQWRNGNWCNLVLFRDVATKTQLTATSTHTHAAYQLAPRYYDWIRLHNGTLSGGLANSTFTLRKTNLYIFSQEQTRPHVQVLTYP